MMGDAACDWLDIAGDSASPAIVLLHASALNRRMWLPVSEALRGAFRVLAPDLPGHGALVTGRFSLDAAVSRVASVLRGLPAPALVAGDSLGGYVAIAVAAACPDRVAALVAGGCTLNPTGLTALALRRLGWQSRLVSALRGRARAVAAEEERLRLAHPAAPLEALIGAGLSPGGRADGLLACAGTDFARLLSGFGGPVMLVNGADDYASRRDEAPFQRAAPHARLTTVPGCAHGVSLAQPARFAELIEAAARSANGLAPQPAAPSA